jgi:hypothetical protein
MDANPTNFISSLQNVSHYKVPKIPRLFYSYLA